LAEEASLSAGIASRFATALFELVRDSGSVDQLEVDVAALRKALAESADLSALIKSPAFDRVEVAGAMARIARRMELGRYLANTLGLMAMKRRLFALPWLLDQLATMIDNYNGVVPAEVVSARPLTDAEVESVTKVLQSKVDQRIILELTVDPDLIGGLKARVGSRMIDDSMQSKLQRLKKTMQEVG